MGRVITDADRFIADCQQVLSAGGRLTTAIAGFNARPQQIELGSEIAKAITDKTILAAEAGTGTGKTYAYLVPCLLSRKKVLIATATKTLQDQLFHKDLPILIRALGIAVRVHNLKGRANYLCRHRIKLHAEAGRFVNPQSVNDLIFIQDKAAQLVNGERAELPEITEDSPVWPYATSTVDNCLGADCEFYQSCFLVKARKKALVADLVVINHHLFFADSRLKEEGFGELLPGVEAVVFDEAHHLAEIAGNFQEQRFSTRQLRDIIDDIQLEWPVLDLVNQPFKELGFTSDKIIIQLLGTVKEEQKISWETIRRQPHFLQLWASLLAIIDELKACLSDETIKDQPGLIRCAKRLNELKKMAVQFIEPDSKQIKWLEKFKNTLVFHATPVEVADYFTQLLQRQDCAYILTSATLTIASSFAAFTKALGIEAAKTVLLPSPFDYKKQALLYLPRGLPDPKNDQYYPALINKALPIITACGGRCFFLFTSHQALKQVAALLVDKLDYPLLIQGEEAKPILLARFRQLGNAVLLGTATFWEGVDVKGDALSCVIIDKLPFANPTDPLIKGKMAYFKAQGKSGFDELSFPNAVLAIKQGAGRLLRDVTDRGVLMLADPRLSGREYGRDIFASLPAMPKTRSEQTVLKFIANLALEHEIISD